METRRNMSLNAPTFRFKSYYVVWKQEDEENKKDKQTSLNRTMQYGNRDIAYDKFKEEWSLNRTMQYGNRKMKNNIILGEIV